MLAMIFIAIDRVKAGRGLETYRTVWMVEDNWIGFLVFVAAAVVALAVGLILRVKEDREIRCLQDEYAHSERDRG